MSGREWSVLTLAQFDAMVEQLAQDLTEALKRAGFSRAKADRKLNSFMHSAKLIRMAIFEEGGFE